MSKLFANFPTILLQNFNIYKRIAVDLFRLPSSDDTSGRMYSTWASLRDVLHDLVENMEKSSEFDGSEAHRDFRLLLLISHYLATRCVESRG